MTVDEMIECGRLMEKLQDGAITSSEMDRLHVLQRQARAELPTGETDIAAALRNDAEWAQRWADLGAFVEKAGKETAEALLKILLAQLPSLLAQATKRQ